MVTRRSVAASVLLAAGILSCSKTQDTAPEKRIFGSPPSIQSVSFTAGESALECDLTKILQGRLCDAGSITPDLYSFSPGPKVSLAITYAELQLLTRVTDPESKPDQSDILLVTASYLTPAVTNQTPDETSLVVLDDGSENEFPYKQAGDKPEACTIDLANGICGCTPAEYVVTTKDETKNDSVFTRWFAFMAAGSGVPTELYPFVLNCLARERREVPAEGSKFIGQTIEFKIEAVDRSGNLTEWPEKPQWTIGPTTADCTGDLCACCILTSSDPTQDPANGGCRGLEGIVGVPGTGFESGLCKIF